MRLRAQSIGRVGSFVAGLALCASAGVSLAEVVAVVSLRSPLTTLTRDQAADLFLGKATRFPDGTSAQPIDLVEGSPVRDEFYRTFAGKSPSQIKAHWSKIIFTGRGRPPPDVASAAEVMKRVSANPDAIGYVPREMVDDTVKVVAR